MIVRVSLAAALACAASPAFAQDAGAAAAASQTTPSIDPSKQTITIAAAGALVPEYDGSKRYDGTPAPGAIGSFKGIGFSLIGNHLSIDLVPQQSGPTWNVEAGPVLAINFDRDHLKSIDDPRIRALGELGTGVELGGYVGLSKTGVITSPYDKLTFSASYRHDVAGVSDGDVITPSLTYLTPLSTKMAAGLFFSATHDSRGYAQTYFGITPLQSLNSGLPVYTPGSGWHDYSVGALYTVSLTGNLVHGWKLIAGGEYTRLLNGFSYSPVVRIAGLYVLINRPRCSPCVRRRFRLG